MDGEIADPKPSKYIQYDGRICLGESFLTFPLDNQGMLTETM
jgi:hypothetical protein